MTDRKECATNERPSRARPGDEIGPTRYRKKPVEIEAMRWCGTNLKEMIDFTGLHPSADNWTWAEYEDVVREKGFKVFSLEASYIVPVGHYIIKGVKGEFYACEPSIFRMTYERADTVSETGIPIHADALDAVVELVRLKRIKERMEEAGTPGGPNNAELTDLEREYKAAKTGAWGYAKSVADAATRSATLKPEDAETIAKLERNIANAKTRPASDHFDLELTRDEAIEMWETCIVGLRAGGPSATLSPKWVPVTERMPIVNGEAVLVTNGVEYAMAKFTTHLGDVRGNGEPVFAICPSDGVWIGEDATPVTHWMALPKLEYRRGWPQVIPKRIREAVETCQFPADQIAAAMRQCAPLLHFHVAMFTPLQPVDAQMQKLALDCYIQGLLDGASSEVRAALEQVRLDDIDGAR